MRPRSAKKAQSKAPLVRASRPFQGPSRRRVLATRVVISSPMERSSATASVRGHGRLTEGSSAVPAVRAVPPSITYARLGKPSVARQRDTATTLRDVEPRQVQLRPTKIACPWVAPIVRTVVRRRILVGRPMVLSTPSLRRPAAAVLTGKAAAKTSRPAISPSKTRQRLRQTTLGVAPTGNGAVITTSAVEASKVVAEPVPTSEGNRPCGRLPGATPLLGPTSGRTTTASSVKATSSGPLGDPIRTPSMSIVLLPQLSHVTGSGILTVLSDYPLKQIRCVKLLSGETTTCGSFLPPACFAPVVLLAIILNQRSKLLMGSKGPSVVAPRAASVRARPQVVTQVPASVQPA